MEKNDTTIVSLKCTQLYLTPIHQMADHSIASALNHLININAKYYFLSLRDFHTKKS